ncbi:hypothetical protein SAMN05444143_1062 [Flavobacterium succinicans]|uniref:Uncharacterized protein n=1 Tax=Flavobacterium succinicans TaxID=29536 RepID=A0A1I4W3K2_9FLAO|nr:hypothetical protein SAMN05444143_1062 [Flavobacterium succinicans]
MGNKVFYAHSLKLSDSNEVKINNFKSVNYKSVKCYFLL